MYLSVVLPAFAEAENLEVILPKIKAALKDIDAEIVVVDTMTPTDQTPRVCEQSGVRYVARRNGNNYGDAIRTGIEEARGKYTLMMDADGSHSPEAIAGFLNEAEQDNCDLVIGSRYCENGETENIAVLRFMSYVLNVSYRVIFRLNVFDISDSFRLYKTEQLKRLKLKCDNFDIVEEILIALTLLYPEMKIKEIPICFKKRAFGESKRNLFKFILSYIFTIFRLLKIKRALKSGK